MSAETFEVAGEKVHVAHATHHAVGLKPQGILLPLDVELLQVSGALEPGGGDHGQQIFEMVEKVILPGVQGIVEAEQRTKIGLQPPEENLPRGRIGGDLGGKLRPPGVGSGVSGKPGQSVQG